MVRKIAVSLFAILVLSSVGIMHFGSSSVFTSASLPVPVMERKVEAAEIRPHIVKSGGTFIQWWLVKDWDDQKWQKEFELLKSLQMEYVVLEPLAFYNLDEKSGAWVTETAYPSDIKGFRRLKGYKDIVDACLRNAEKYGIKVFLGLNFSEEWWSNRHNAAWINERVKEGNRIAEELWSKYKDKYPASFFGWYWCWETDNIYFKRYDPYNSAQILTNAINLFTDHLESKGIRLPIMLSPYMNWMLGTPGGNGSLWEYVLLNSGLKAGDILCPQDSIGTGGLNRKNYVQWFSELRKAVNKAQGIQLWADTEIFMVSNWNAVTIDKFIAQMSELEPYVDNFLTFSYSHYYSPNIINSGFNETYRNYLLTGVLESIPPTTPENLKFTYDGNGSVRLAWDASYDDTGVCGYLVFRNGKQIADIQVQRSQSDIKPQAASNYTDSSDDRPRNPVYHVRAYDFAGNMSPNSAEVTFNEN